jgi:hypothetical protein
MIGASTVPWLHHALLRGQSNPIKSNPGLEEGFPNMVLLIYDGIHYDALALTPFQGMY